ncbi:MAG: outer membrane beta-barrel protein [Bacteroidia bacterium]
MEEDNENKSPRSVIRDYKMDPPENAWSAIDAALTKKQEIIYRQKTKRYKWLSIGLALLLIFSVSSYYFILQQSPNSLKNPAGQKFTADHQSSVIANNDPQLSTAESAGSNLQVIETHDEKIHAAGKSEIKSNHDNYISAKNSFRNKPASAKMNNKSNADDTEEISYENKPNNNDDDRTKLGTYKEDVIAKHNKSKTNNGSSGDQSLTNSNGENSSAPGISDIDFMQTIDLTTTEKSELSIRNSPAIIHVNDSVEVNNKSFISRFSLAAYYSPDLTKNYLKDNNVNDAEGTSAYKNREKSAYSFSTGLSIGFDLNKRWSINTGCTYSTMAYSIAVSTIYAAYGEDNQLHYYYPTSCGDIEMPKRKNTVIHEGDSLNLNAVCEQSIEFINVPVQMRFHTVKNRFTFFADAGFSANFYINEKAKMNVNNYKYTIYNNIYGLKKMNYSILFGLGVQYNFCNGLGAFIEPSFKGSVTSLTQDTSVNCFPYTLGLHAGLSFHF